MSIAIDLLQYAAVAIALLCAWLMLRMQDEYQMMHFLAPPASVSVTLITIAIFLQQGHKPESFKALFIVMVLVAMNTVVTHATARAFRIRQVRDEWQPLEGQEVPLQPGDETIKPGSEEK
jgi:multisubunit Na+/H+ antiporter MnhG subunit